MYNSQNVLLRINALIDSKKVVKKEMFAKIGLHENTLSNMKNSMPKADNLAKIADYLECSVDYLLGRTNSITLSDSNKPPKEADKQKFYKTPSRTLYTYRFNSKTGVMVSAKTTKSSVESLLLEPDTSNNDTLELVKLIQSLSSTDKAQVLGYIHKLKEGVPVHV